MNPRRMVSDDTAQAIDEEVKAIVEQGHNQALMILKNNLDLMESIAQKILETEVIEGDELQGLLEQVKTPDALRELATVA
jgi:cell division protease FtsH